MVSMEKSKQIKERMNSFSEMLEKRVLFNYVNPVLYRVMGLCKSVRELHFPGLLCGVSAEKW